MQNIRNCPVLNSQSTIFSIYKINFPWMIGLQCLCYLCGKLWVVIRLYYLHITFQKISLLVNASTFNSKDQSFYIGQFGIALNMQREYFM